MSEKTYQLSHLREKNILIRIKSTKGIKEQKVNGLIVNKPPKLHRIAEIVMVGKDVNPDLVPGTMLTVFVQSLEYEFDADVQGLDSVNYRYFMILETQVVSVLKEVTNGETTSV